MVNNYLLLAFRNFGRNKVHTSINILGLSVGIAAAILTVMFLVDEHSFDDFHTKRDRIYRLNKINIEPDGSTSPTAETSGLMGPTMARDFPEVESFVRYMPWFNKVAMTVGEKNIVLNEQELVFVDSSFFSVFDFNLLRGDIGGALRKPGSIVLTETTARAMFGDQDPVGRTLIGLQDLEFEVTGIVEDPPRNSHMQFKGLISWTTTVPQVGPLALEFMNNWIAQAVCTYIVTTENADLSALETKFPKFMSTYIPTRIDKYRLYLQPFRDLYLGSAGIQALKMQRTGSRDFNYLFSVISAFILFLACINYINIQTSRATRRAREVAMRKSLGASKKQLITQFLGESLLMVSLAALIAVGILLAAVPYFNDLTGKLLPYSLMMNGYVMGGTVALVLLVTLASGAYPAFVLSGFAPAMIHGSGRTKVSGNVPRYALIVFQFIITMCMLTGTIFIYRQIRFILAADVGFDKEHVVVVNLTRELMPNREVLRNAVTQQPNVISTSTSQTALGLGTFSTYVIPEGFNPDEVEARVFAVDANFQKTYGLSMAQGRFFEAGSSSDSASVIINEAMLRRLNWSDAQGKSIKLSETSPALPVIGVAKDFRFRSFYEAVEPLVMFVSPANQRNLAVRFSGDPGNIISVLEEEWKKIEQRYPFSYFFIDETFARAYDAEQKLLQTVVTFSGISILIACLGLYGLITFTVEQRTKEFGVRKVLGASVWSLSMLVNRKFILLVVTGSLIAVPVTIPFLQQWLAKFTLAIAITPKTFLIPFATLAGITLITVMAQTIKAALRNPAESLRHE